MAIWYEEFQGNNVKLSVAIDKQLWGCDSDYQRIEMLESVEFGKIIVRDGRIVFSEKDEFKYYSSILIDDYNYTDNNWKEIQKNLEIKLKNSF